ncbi:hypothetical protein D5W64_12740 [Salmonella enterica subsp. enterica serovar Saintpaul]|nr:hypothetical protein [Salmonella enterica subsp. enterica serovar Saintpaul]
MYKVISFVAAIFLLICSGWIGYNLYIDDYSSRTDLVALTIISIVMTITGCWLLFITFFEDWLLRKMYGEFSNRNPWGY